MKYTVIIEQEQGGGYSIYVPELPGCASQGETIAEANKNIKKAIHLYLWSIAEDKRNFEKRRILVKKIAA